MRILAVVLLVACGKGDRETKQAPKPTGAPAGSFANLKVTVDNQPFPADRAYVRRTSADVYTVLVGHGKGSCESLLAGTEDPSGKAFSFTITKRVAPTGHENWFITDLWSRDFALEGTQLPAKAKLEGTAEAGTNTTIEIPALANKVLQLSGSLVALGCGEGAAPTGVGVPRQPKKMAGTITVAGKPLQVRGAIVSARNGVDATDLPNITISTNVKDCSSATLPAAVILERTDGTWSLRGTWFDAPIEGTADATKELTFSANSVGKSADGATLVLQLSGTGKIGDYSVKLDGTAEAIECVK